MQIIEPYAHIISSPIEYLKTIEAIARVSHRSEEAQTDDSWFRFIKSVVVDKGDWSVTEHINVTVQAVVDRGISHEWVRHRIGAYTQESTRFVNYTKEVHIPKFIMPFGLKEENRSSWIAGIKLSLYSYNALIEAGEPPEIARSVFPFAMASKLICTYNLRMWRHFFLMRTTKETHRQLRQVTIPLLTEFKSQIPLLYDDIEPEKRQILNMQKAH